jgi:phenylpropionate dioxygenase-like ring-hydroxylating dioxygenase large terminal subunit
MFSNITPKYYFDSDIFEREKHEIFKNNWIFVCFKQDLLNNNDFVTKTVGGVPIVVQNINNEIKAFMNVCSHRFSTLQTSERGNRALFCPYHGWAYNKEGKPTGIPKRPLFKEFSEQELCDLKLKEYSLDYCGDLVFVHINTPNISLKESLGDFFDEIQNLFNDQLQLVDTNKINIKSNWKVVVENTLESYHVNLVHSDTFKKLGAKGLDFAFTNKHSKWDAELALHEDDAKLSKIHNLFSNRLLKKDGYSHYIVFPNLLISTSYGISFNFSIIDPISANDTAFTSYVFLSKPKKESGIYDMYKQSLVQFNRQVFDEDTVICEEVQKGVIVTDKQGVLSLEEKRVHEFQLQYINDMNGDCKN